MQTENVLNPSHPLNGFTAQFPNRNIDANDTLLLVLSEDYSSVYTDITPDLFLFEEENGSMIETESGSFGLLPDKLDDASESIILFKWDKNIEHNIEDVDYFIWGGIQGAVDKSITSIEGGNYVEDTPADEQMFFKQVHDDDYAYSRVAGLEETNEEGSGGNGIMGEDETRDDETSEDLRQSWEIIPIVEIGCTDSIAENYNSDAIIDDGSCTINILDIINGEYNKETITVEGLIVDYFDITVFNGPHSLTISDQNNNELEVSIWDDVMTDTLYQLTNYPMAKYKISVNGLIKLFPDTNDNGICDEPDDDDPCSLPESQWECTDESEPSGDSAGRDNSDEDEYDHCKWQLQLSESSDLKIIETNTITYPEVEFSELLSYSNDIKSSPFFHKNITIKGLLIDYTDITTSCGPHVMTLEDSDKYRLEVITFDANWSNMLSCLTSSQYKTQYLEVKGYVGEYKNEIQISFDNDTSIVLLENISYEETCYTENIEDVSINPAPYVIIPTRGETLDFSFTVLKETRAIVRIFDLSGRFITSLVDDYYEDAVRCDYDDVTPWNGRDKLGQIVSPGTYIMHLEVFNPATGETQTDAAPIVVGVKN